MLCTHLVGIRINQQQTPIFLLWMCLQTLYLFLEGSESFSAAKGRSAILGRVSFWVLRDGQNIDSNGSKYAALFIRHEYMEHGWLHSWPLQALRSSCPRGCPWHHCRWSCHIPVRFLPDNFLLQSLSLHWESNFLEGILCNKSIHKCSNFPPLFSTCKNLQKWFTFSFSSICIPSSLCNLFWITEFIGLFISAFWTVFSFSLFDYCRGELETMLQWLHWAEAAYEGDKSSLAKAMKVHIWILAFTKEDNLC